MTHGVIYIDDADARLDELAQRILVMLDNEDEPLPAADIANELGEQRQSVWYRLQEHLTAADYVTSTSESPERWTQSDGPYWTLSAQGEMYVEVKRDELARPKTLETMSREVHEAVQEATAAKESVQDYRKDLYQIKQGQESIEEELDDLRSKDELTHRDEVRLQELVANQVRQDIMGDLDMLDAKLGDMGRLDLEDCHTVADALAKIIRGLDNHQEALERHGDTLADIEVDIADIRVALAETDEEVAEIDKRLEAEESSWF